MSEPAKPVIIDAGSGLVKAGIAGEDAPTAVFPTVVGVPKENSAMQGVEFKNYYVGPDAVAKRGILHCSYPIEHGLIVDWDGMERIWDHTFNQELKVDPSSQPIILTEGPANPKSNRERSMEIMFGKFQTPAAYVQQTAVLAMYASGRTTGLAVESGDGVTHVVPIYEGFAVRKAILRMDQGGLDATQVLQRELKAEGVSLSSSAAQLEIVQDIKEKLCYVAPDYEAECQRPVKDLQEHYELPDGSLISVGQARFKAAEAMFDPKRMLEIEDELGGVCGMVVHSIQANETDLRAALGRNIVLAGGNTMMTGFPERLEGDLGEMLSTDRKVHAPPERRNSVWIGASILGCLSSFDQMAVTREEYEEEGSAVVHRKCF